MTNSIKQIPMWMRQALYDIEQDEGFREFAYPDPLSVLGKKYRKEKWGYVPASTILAKLGLSAELGKPWTVGIGFTHGVGPNSQMKRNVAQHKLESVVLEHLWVLDKWVPGWKNYPDVVKSVLANMAFNLGSRLLQFGATGKLLREGKFAAAGENLKRTAWYKQVGKRAVRLTTRLKTGVVEADRRIN